MQPAYFDEEFALYLINAKTSSTKKEFQLNRQRIELDSTDRVNKIYMTASTPKIWSTVKS